jgi:hypothetical protein
VTKYDYDGWAPCAHNEEDIAKAIEWLKDQTPDFHGQLNSKFEPIQGGLLEDMIWQLTDLTGRGDIQFDCDQWWGVFVKGRIYIDHKAGVFQDFSTKVQADTLLLGVAETLRWWAEKYKELHG